MSGVRHYFVERGDPLYQAAVQLRYEVFFQPTATSLDHLHDRHEVTSLHGVATSGEGELLGYVRLTLEGAEVGRVSQLVVRPDARGKMGVLAGLYRLVIARARQARLARLVADVRLPNIPLCERVGFVRRGPPFPSVKTQIPHQRMELDLGACRAEAEPRRAL